MLGKGRNLLKIGAGSMGQNQGIS